MIVYLDQNKIIELAGNPQLLTELQSVLAAKGTQVGISFAHACETATIPSARRVTDIVKTVTALPYVHLRSLMLIVQDEIMNEFYRFLKVPRRRPSQIVGAFGPEHPQTNFGMVVTELRNNTNRGDAIRASIDGYQAEIVRDLSKHKQTNRELVETGFFNVAEKYLTSRNIQLSGLVLLPGSISFEDFRKHFDFSNCPHINFMVDFQLRRYKDRVRKLEAGDFCDTEHATHGSISCDVLVIERFAREMVEQIGRSGLRLRAKSFSDLREAISYLQDPG